MIENSKVKEKSPTITPDIEQVPMDSIIDDINNLNEGDYVLIALNNDITPFNSVVEVLCNKLPCHPQVATMCALCIHEMGSCEVLIGSYGHCEEVKDALANIKVKSNIIPLDAIE